jgi:DNA-binding CsgD family transcriptional regulator
MGPALLCGLLERGRELESLGMLVEAARRGLGGVALVLGEAGIGKTALLDAARQLAAPTMPVRSATARELEAEFAWGVVRQLFRDEVEHDRDTLIGAAVLGRPPLGVDPSSGATDATYAAVHGLYWLTADLAEQGPLLLVVDDVHWADPPSLRFLAHLAARVDELGVVLLLASRPAATEGSPASDLLARLAADPATRILRPAPLSESASTTLTRAELSDGASAEFCRACHDVTGGNPFLLHALLADLADHHVVPSAASVVHVRRRTPTVVSARVLVRLARLPSGARDLVRAVAIHGGRADLRQARLLVGLDVDEGAEMANAVLRAGILELRDGCLCFVHPLVHAAVYADLSGPDRGRWHLRAARVLAADGAPPAAVAAHLVEGAANGDPWVVEQLRAAAAAAVASGAPEIAADYLRRAVAEPPADTVRADVLFELGRIEAARDPVAAVRPLSHALALTGCDPASAPIALALGDALMLAGRLADAVEILGRGLAAAGAAEPGVRALLEAAQLSAARWEPSAQGLRRALVSELCRRVAAGESLDPRLHCQLAIEACATGADRAEAVAHARAALVEDARALAGATSVPEAILVLVFAGEAAEAKASIDAWLVEAQRRAWPLGISMGSTCASLAALYRGAVGDALAHADGAVAGNAEVRLAPVTVAFLVEALIERAELDRAAAELAERGLDRELPMVWATTPLLLARGRLRAAAGDHPAAVADLLAAGERCALWDVANPAMVPWRSSAALSLSRLGEHERAKELADEEVGLAEQWGSARALGVALRVAGTVRAGEDGLELLRRAVAVLDSSSALLERARARTELGAAVRRAGRRVEARGLLRDGLDLAQRVGGVAVADRAREELVVAGGRPRRDARRGREALTPAELRVAQLAAAGRTNRQIAEDLFLTVRTVETHLTSSYLKLGITSRRALAGALGSDPPPD